MNPRSVAATLLLLLLSCCGWDDNAQLRAPSPGYPCGPVGVVCATQHTCCGQDETCGGEPGSVGCPAGECCFIGGGAQEFGKRSPHIPQTPQRSR